MKLFDNDQEAIAYLNKYDRDLDMCISEKKGMLESMQYIARTSKDYELIDVAKSHIDFLKDISERLKLAISILNKHTN